MILDLLLYYIYLLLLIVAVGPNVTSAIWIQRAMANLESLSFTLQGIKFINDRIVLPATGLITVTWIVMVVISGQSLLIPWILLVAVFWLVIFLLGLFLYTPRLRKQIALAESPGSDSDEYKHNTDEEIRELKAIIKDQTRLINNLNGTIEKVIGREG